MNSLLKIKKNKTVIMISAPPAVFYKSSPCTYKVYGTIGSFY